MKKLLESYRRVLSEEISQEYIDTVLKFMKKKAQPSDYPFNYMFDNKWRIVVPIDIDIAELARTSGEPYDKIYNALELAKAAGWKIPRLEDGVAFKMEKQTNPKTGETIDRKIEMKLAKMWSRLVAEKQKAVDPAKMAELQALLDQQVVLTNQRQDILNRHGAEHNNARRDAIAKEYHEKERQLHDINNRVYAHPLSRKGTDIKTLQDAIKIWGEQSEKMIGGFVIIVSQHPIDVLRMSDFQALQSCHSEGGAYFKCAIEEAQAHGPIAFLLSRGELKKYENKLQEPEFFADKGFKDSGAGGSKRPHGRDVDGATPIGRVRLREYSAGSYHFIAPETRQYGTQITSFLPTLKKWLHAVQDPTMPESMKDVTIGEIKEEGGTYHDTSKDTMMRNYFGRDIPRSSLKLPEMNRRVEAFKRNHPYLRLEYRADDYYGNFSLTPTYSVNIGFASKGIKVRNRLDNKDVLSLNAKLKEIIASKGLPGLAHSRPTLQQSSLSVGFNLGEDWRQDCGNSTSMRSFNCQMDNLEALTPKLESIEEELLQWVKDELINRRMTKTGAEALQAIIRKPYENLEWNQAEGALMTEEAYLGDAEISSTNASKALIGGVVKVMRTHQIPDSAWLPSFNVDFDITEGKDEVVVRYEDATRGNLTGEDFPGARVHAIYEGIYTVIRKLFQGMQSQQAMFEAKDDHMWDDMPDEDDPRWEKAQKKLVSNKARLKKSVSKPSNYGAFDTAFANLLRPELHIHKEGGVSDVPLLQHKRITKKSIASTGNNSQLMFSLAFDVGGIDDVPGSLASSEEQTKQYQLLLDMLGFIDDHYDYIVEASQRVFQYVTQKMYHNIPKKLLSHSAGWKAVEAVVKEKGLDIKAIKKEIAAELKAQFPQGASADFQKTVAQ